MTLQQRALQAWGLLAWAARNQQIVSYTMLEDLTGFPQQYWGKPLGMIHRYCTYNGFPPLNVIVVNQPDGIPGENYPKRIADGGLEVFRDQARVFVFDWRKKVPSEDDPNLREWEPNAAPNA